MFGLVALPAALLASPMISVDSADFDVGIIYPSGVKTIKHTFKVTNTGDSVLKIKQVKPG
jgi:hypothetical protein